MLKSTDEGRNRILDGLRRYTRIVAQARTRGMNDRDTADVVKAMLSDMLGYDPFFDITAEASTRGPLCDYAILSGDRLNFLLIVNPVGAPPNIGQLLKLSGAAAPPYADWLVLTNADVWTCYRLGVGTDRHAELVFRVSLLDNGPAEEKVKYFQLLSKESVTDGSLSGYWQQTHVLNPGRIASILLSEDALSMLRREIHRKSGYRVDRNALYEVLVRQILRSEALAARSVEDDGTPRLPQCYAYVSNPHDPSTWRCRYRNADGSASIELLTLAVVDMDTEGRISGIPADDIPIVKERLRRAYEELKIPPAQIPNSLKA
jgi:hypothetical protein